MAAALIQDSEWVKTSFMLPKYAADLIDARTKVFTTAAMKFTDTTLGGNFAINPPPQFTEYADLRVQGRYAESRGLGRKYSEMLDDNGQLIHMRFGVPEFNSLTTFFTRFYDASAASLSRTGRAPGFFYNLGRAAGFVVTLPLYPLIAAGDIYRFLADEPASKFYYLKPTMPLYWNAVNGIANAIAVNMGIVPRVFSDDSNAAEPGYPDHNSSKYGASEIQYTADDVASNHRHHGDFMSMTDVFMKGGGIDIYAVANKGQRLADQALRRQKELIEQSGGNSETLRQSMIRFMQESVSDPYKRDFESYIQDWNATQAALPAESEQALESAESNRQTWYSLFVTHAVAEIRDGSQFVTFRVNHTGTPSESFSNSTGESELSQTVNGMSSQSRSKMFNFAGGSTGIPGVDDVIGAVKDVLVGLSDGLSLGGLAVVAGNAFADIPKMWLDSSSSLPTTTYEIELRSPYGNKWSRFMNLYVPLSMILAGALPKSAGMHSYDSPFLCQIFDKGRAQVRLGIIDSLSITRGVGNLGWTRDMEPLGINISFSVVDLSSVLHMPINASPGLFDEDNAYTDYLATLGSLGLADQVYVTRKLQLNMTRYMTSMKKWLSPAKYASWAGGTLPGRVISWIARNTDRP